MLVSFHFSSCCRSASVNNGNADNDCPGSATAASSNTCQCSNIRATARAAATPSGNGQTWDRYYLYKPEMLEKVIEIYRFTHNWMGSRQTKKTPAMKLGLAKGRIYERDLFG